MSSTAFGITIACSDQSFLFVEGCCSSIRHFLGDVPICVIVDGAFSTRRLQRTYGVSVIDRRSAIDPRLARSFGWGITKMISLWESPWPAFLSLDPDTIVWGDVPALADFERFDVVLDEQYTRDERGAVINPAFHDFLGQPPPDAALRKAVVNRCLFDTDALERHFPRFDWKRWLYQYSWTGAWFARRGLFTVDEYLALLDFADAHPGVFLGGEMGLLNFLIFRAAQEGRIRVGSAPLQVLVCEEPEQELRQRFAVAAEPRVQPRDAAVIHWTGAQKPTLRSPHLAEPMTFMRRKYQRDARGLTGVAADMVLRWQDLARWYYKKRYDLRHG